MSEETTIKLSGRIFLTFNIRVLSGMHIGGSTENISIGGVDKTVIRNPLDNRPYIPGSSLRGKVRSLLEKYGGAVQNKSIGQATIHSCQGPEDYKDCDICQVFGVPGDMDFSAPTRLIVRDVQLSDDSAEELNRLRTDLPFTEVKTEVAIDRVTSAASPRQMERVPAGTVFGGGEMVYSLYSLNGSGIQGDLDRFETVLTGLQLLEDDYLGGLGSRGSGKIGFEDIRLAVRASKAYGHRQTIETGTTTVDGLLTNFATIRDKLAAAIQG